MGHLIAHLLGMDNGSGPIYLAWSGFGGDISQLALLGAAYGLVRKHNCHSKGCWRIGRHLVDGTPWCDRHHQDARGGGAGDG